MGYYLTGLRALSAPGLDYHVGLFLFLIGVIGTATKTKERTAFVHLFVLLGRGLRGLAGDVEASGARFADSDVHF